MKSEFGDTNSKDIWGNKLLCSQFLRDYSGIPILEDVRPEDIEDVTEQMRPFVGVEFEGDAVKRVHLPDKGEVYVIGLLDHKSKVDYDVTFQLLKYMVGIWTDYRNREDKGVGSGSRGKGFQYPLIIPIVYYEGNDRWTAARHFKERVEFSDMFGEYVPDFTYRLVDLHRFSKEELLSNEDEISLFMIFNRMQTADDLDIAKWPEDFRKKAEEIVKKAPEAVLRLLSQMVHHFGVKLHLPDEDVRRYVRNVEEREMGELWANMEKIDIQEEWRKLDEGWAEVERKRDELQRGEDEFQRKKDELQRKENEVQKEADELQRKKDEFQREKDELQRKEDKFQRKKDELQRKENEVQKEKAKVQKEADELSKLKQRLAEAEAANARLQAELEQRK